MIFWIGYVKLRHVKKNHIFTVYMGLLYSQHIKCVTSNNANPISEVLFFYSISKHMLFWNFYLKENYWLYITPEIFEKKNSYSNELIFDVILFVMSFMQWLNNFQYIPYIVIISDFNDIISFHAWWLISFWWFFIITRLIFHLIPYVNYHRLIV